MILQSLVRHYDALAARGMISPVGWSMAKVSFALEIAQDGTLLHVLPMKIPSQDGKREIPQIMRVPEQVKKTSGVAANFLCGNAAYLLGIDIKGNPERTRKCFEASKALHHKILDGVNNNAAEAVLRFFDTWQIGTAESDEKLADCFDEINAGANLIFKTPDGENVQDQSEIKTAWENFNTQKSGQAARMLCLVTGEKAPVARLHPYIKGIRGAQSSGASLVSYNAPAFESYGHEMASNTGQGLNGPVSELAAFKYATALNYLVADKNHVQYLADTTILYWAGDAEPAYQDYFSAEAFGSSTISAEDLKGIINALASGNNICSNGVELKADNPFYILGLAPNASRLSVRFFLQSEFGQILKNLHKHNERLDIVRPSYETRTTLPLWVLLNETANQNAKTKMPPPPMAGATLRAILMGNDYPASLFENVMLRIRAEHDISWRKAAIIKAYCLKNRGITVPKEVLKVELNEESNYTPYVLGRLFAVLETVQVDSVRSRNQSAKLTTTIKDRYFTSASATPALVFPRLLTLSQHHQRKLSEGGKIYYGRKISNLASRLRETLPTRLTLQEQGAFQLGYYHEKQALFTSNKKENNEEDSQL